MKSTNTTNINLINKVKYRQLKTKMGQKTSKSNQTDNLNSLNIDSTIPNHTINLNINTNNLIRSKFNHHDSALSNDSGCYSNTDSVERYSSPSNSSVTCLFDQQQTNLSQQQHEKINEILLQKCNKIEKNDEHESKIKSHKSISKESQKLSKDSETKHVKKHDYLSLLTKAKKETKLNESPNGSLSSLDMLNFNSNNNNNSRSSSLSRRSVDNFRVKIDVVYKQINHILHLKSKLTTDENNTNEDNSRSRSEKKTTLKNNKKSKEINNFEAYSKSNDKNSTIIDKLNSLRYPNKSYLSRSHTFNSTNIPVYAASSMDNVQQNTINNNNNSKSIKLGKSLVKNGKKFFIWKKSTNNQDGQKQIDADLFQASKCRNKLNLSPNFDNTDESNGILNLLAAKLLSENVDLAKYPYTDNVSKIFPQTNVQ